QREHRGGGNCERQRLHRFLLQRFATVAAWRFLHFFLAAASGCGAVVSASAGTGTGSLVSSVSELSEGLGSGLAAVTVAVSLNGPLVPALTVSVNTAPERSARLEF